MSVTEQVMGWGSWSINLRGEPDDTIPAEIWAVLNPAVNAYGHILITPARVNPDAVGDAGMLAISKYTGIYRGNPSRNEIGGVGLVGWLGDEDDKGAIAETAKTGGAATFAGWVADVRPAALAAGSVTAIAGTLTESMLYMTPRAMLGRVMDYFGGVYRVNPDFTLDAGTEADLFDTAPTVLLKYNASGPDMGLRGIRASSIDLARDLEDYTTRVVLLADDVGVAGGVPFGIGTANISPATPFKDGLGNAVVFKRIINMPDVSVGNANTLAAAQLGRFNHLRKSYSLSTSEWGVIFGDVKRLEPGDHIWVYDPRPDAQLVDTTNQVVYQGQVLLPVDMRLEAVTWPIQEGMGVYFRYWNGAAYTTVDLSSHVEYESGDTTLDVGAAARRLTTDPTPAQIQARISPTFGVLGYTEVTAGSNGITTITDLISVVVDVAPGHLIKVTGHALAVQRTGAGVVTAAIREGSTVLGEAGRHTLQTNEHHGVDGSVILAPSSGSHTYKLAMSTTANTVDWGAGSDHPSFILVEDIGLA